MNNQCQPQKQANGDHIKLIPQKNMKKIPFEKQSQILSLLVEGNSIRSIERLIGVTPRATINLLQQAGIRAQAILDNELQDLNCKFIEVDEIWTFVGKKQKQCTESEKVEGGLGDQYIYVAIDAETKLVPLYMIGKRCKKLTTKFMNGLNSKLSDNTKKRFQISTDGYNAYPEAIYLAFDNADYSQVRKQWAIKEEDDRKYSPSPMISIEKMPFFGNPNLDMVSTSFVERQNLTMRMGNRRLTRLTNGFSKKIENLEYQVALHFYYYNFMRIHSSLRMTPAMKARVTNRIWSWKDLLYGERIQITMPIN